MFKRSFPPFWGGPPAGTTATHTDMPHVGPPASKPPQTTVNPYHLRVRGWRHRPMGGLPSRRSGCEAAAGPSIGPAVATRRFRFPWVSVSGSRERRRRRRDVCLNHAPPTADKNRPVHKIRLSVASLCRRGCRCLSLQVPNTQYTPTIITM